MQRYTFWHLTEFVGDQVLAKRYIAEGRKYLGYVIEQRALGGVWQNLWRTSNAEGVKFEVSILGDVPTLKIDVTSLPENRNVVDIAGFVTWPTDESGETAIPESVRIILAGSEYRAVRESQYTPLFPEDGLNKAGNVDWHGRGWVLSWYGPRTRYFESTPELKPYVYAKGRPIVDARDYIDTDALILGAAVVTKFGGPWLVVVSEDFFFGRWEDVWVIRLIDADTGEPASAKTRRYDVVEDSFELLDSREVDNFALMRHPWFFHPDGSEGRMIAEGASGDVTEFIITLEENDDNDSGIGVVRSEVAHETPARVTSSGYVGDPNLCVFDGSMEIIKRQEESAVSLGLPTGIGPWPATHTDSGTFVEERTTGTYTAAGSGLTDYEYSQTANAGSQQWQVAAVDYKASGEVVYGYVRQLNQNVNRVGTYGPETEDSITHVEFNYTDNTWSSGGQTSGDDPEDEHVWLHELTYNVGATVSGFSVDMVGEDHEVEDTILMGVRVGNIDVVSVRQITDDKEYSSGFEGPGGAVSLGVPQTQMVADGTLLDYSDLNAPSANLPPGFYGVPSVRSAYAARHQVRTEVDQLLFLAHMDLRYDALFVVTQTQTEDLDESYTFDWEDIYSDLVAELTTPTGAQVHQRTRHRGTTWRVQGWVHGASVVDETVTTRDEQDDIAPEESDLPLYTTPNVYGNIIVYSEWHRDWAGPTPYGDTFSVIPNFRLFTQRNHDFDWPVDADDLDLPAVFGGNARAIDFNYDDFGYQVTNTTFPVLQLFLLSWHIEVEATPPEIVGYSFGAVDDPDRVKVKWHYDEDEIGYCGSWAFYKEEWAFSMSLPTPAEDDDFRMLSLCRIDTIAERALTDEEIDEATVEHFYPIWVLPPTKGFTPPGN